MIGKSEQAQAAGAAAETGTGSVTEAFLNGEVLTVLNMGTEPLSLPAGEVLVASDAGAGTDGVLLPNHAVWLRLG